MKVSIEYRVIGSKKKNSDYANEVYVPDGWTVDQIKEWYEDKHHSLFGIGVEVINIEIENEVSNESK